MSYKFILSVGDVLEMEYDYGAGWEFTIELLSITEMKTLLKFVTKISQILYVDYFVIYKSDNVLDRAMLHSKPKTSSFLPDSYKIVRLPYIHPAIQCFYFGKASSLVW